jgi:hypothetical protein
VSELYTFMDVSDATLARKVLGEGTDEPEAAQPPLSPRGPGQDAAEEEGEQCAAEKWLDADISSCYQAVCWPGNQHYTFTLHGAACFLILLSPRGVGIRDVTDSEGAAPPSLVQQSFPSAQCGMQSSKHCSTMTVTVR